MGTENPHELENMMDEDIETRKHETEHIAHAVTAVGDGLPAFGIVAAVLGVIVTMGSIAEPPEVLGALIGAALVGTFLGILLAYGVVGPMGKNLENFCESGVPVLRMHQGGRDRPCAGLRTGAVGRVRPQDALRARPADLRRGRRIRVQRSAGLGSGN